MTDDLLPEGLADNLPAQSALLTRAMRAALLAMDAHGYDRVSPPLIEFEKSLGSRMDGLQTRAMFRFVDPACLRTLALRSDITPQIGRIAATALADRPRPLRLCYAGEVVRIAADQLDPVRQRLQIGAELIGADSVAAATEVVLTAIEALEAAGVRSISVDFTLPDLVSTLAQGAFPLAREQAEAVRRELDTKDAGGLKAVGGEAFLPLIHAAGPFEDALAKLREIDAGGALASRIAGLVQIAAAIGDRARITLDPTERHGFEYQSWFGFTLYAGEARGALGRGGTYCIQGTDEPATGFSIYLGQALPLLDEGDPRAMLFLPLGHDRTAARRFRAEGWRTVAALAEDENPRLLGCTHRLDGVEPQPL